MLELELEIDIRNTFCCGQSVISKHGFVPYSLSTGPWLGNALMTQLRIQFTNNSFVIFLDHFGDGFVFLKLAISIYDTSHEPTFSLQVVFCVCVCSKL